MWLLSFVSIVVVVIAFIVFTILVDDDDDDDDDDDVVVVVSIVIIFVVFVVVIVITSGDMLQASQMPDWDQRSAVTSGLPQATQKRHLMASAPTETKADADTKHATPSVM